MRVEWHFDEDDIARVKTIVSRHVDNPFVKERQRRNLVGERPKIGLDEFWSTMAGCLLTTRQKSGPDSPVKKFTDTKPFPLSYGVACSQSDRRSFFVEKMSQFGGIQRYNNIADELTTNYDTLQSGLWQGIQCHLERLRVNTSRSMEREAADFIDDKLKGLGPKQARNLLQWLGLTRFEIPLDSRIMKWLRSIGFPVPLSSSALGDKRFYAFVMDGIIGLCEQCEVFPCILDASVFASYDERNWRNDRQ